MAGHRKRKIAPLIMLMFATSMVALPQPSIAAPCDVAEPRIVQPLEGSTLQVARVASQTSTGADWWELKVDAWMCTDTNGQVIVPNLFVEHLVRGVVVKTNTMESWMRGADAATRDVVLPARSENWPVFYRSEFEKHLFPLPDELRLTFNFDLPYPQGRRAVTRTYGVAEYLNTGRLGSYFYPFKQDELPYGMYWRQKRHADINNHQRWAYDFVLMRYDKDGDRWVDDHVDTSAKLSFGRNVYAMSDGEIIGCNRQAVDNFGGSKNGNVAGGNLIWLRNGNETTLYAHFEQDSIPSEICPFAGDKEHKAGDPSTSADDSRWTVKAGMFLGRVGSSGYSQSGPHLHVHVFKGLPKIWGGSEIGIDSDARPLRFVNGRAQQIVDNAWVKIDGWNRVNGAVSPPDSHIEPNPCRYTVAGLATAPQIVAEETRSECFLDYYNVLVQSGYRPLQVEQGHDVYVHHVWRRDEGVPWQMFVGLDAAGLQEVHNEWFLTRRYRYLHVEPYERNGALRHTVILVKQPGGEQWLDPNMAFATLDATFDVRTKAGYRPVAISAAEVGTSVRYTALYEKTNVGTYSAKPKIPLSSYSDEFDAHTAAGLHLASVDAYQSDGKTYLSAIFYSALDSRYDASGAITPYGYVERSADHLANDWYARTLTGVPGKTFGIWRPAPETRIVTSPPSHTSSQTAQFNFAAGDPLVTYECKLDIAAWTACVSPRKFTEVSPGSHTFQVRARDRHGYVDPSPASKTWVVDLTGPTEVTLTRPRAGHSYFMDNELNGSATGQTSVVGAVTVRATARDAESGIDRIRFTVDGVYVPDSKVKYDASGDYWYFTWNKATPGLHRLAAVAYNRAQVAAASPTRNVVYSSGLAVR